MEIVLYYEARRNILIYGSGFLGSPTQLTTTANQELIPVKPNGWTMGYNCYKFSFANNLACTIKINNGNPIWLNAGQGFNSDAGDALITSFVVVESDVSINWIAVF